MQVVTSENILELHQTGKVAEYKAPDAKPAEGEVKGEPDKVSFKKADGSDVEFTKSKADKADKDASEVTTEKAADKAAATDDDEDADLPERVKRQIGKKHRAMKEAEEFARQLYGDKTAAEQKAEKLERELNALRNPQQSKANSGEPDPKDYKTNAEYIDAMVEYKFEKKERAEAERRNEQAQAKAQAEFVDRLNAVRKEIPDFDEVVGDADYEVAPHLASYIAESEYGPKLGYHFAKHPEELERISKLSPIRGIAELGKLEIKLDTKPEAKVDAKAEAEKPAAKVSGAPSPITPVDASGKAAVTKDPAKMTLQELREYDRQQREAKRR